MRLVASGSAPLAAHVEEFLKTVMCAPVAQGYGLTETCGSSFIALPEPVRFRTRSIGLSVLCNLMNWIACWEPVVITPDVPAGTA